MRKKAVWIGGAVLLTVVLAVFYTLDPQEYAFFPRCPFLVATGYTCPGCGSQRAIHQLLHLNIGEAFHRNAFLVLSLPIIGVLLLAEWRRQTALHFYARVHSLRFTLFYLVAVLLWWVMRNVFGW